MNPFMRIREVCTSHSIEDISVSELNERAYSKSSLINQSRDINTVHNNLLAQICRALNSTILESAKYFVSDFCESQSAALAKWKRHET